MSIGTVIGLVLVLVVVSITILYLTNQADKRRKMEQRAAKVAKKAEADANRAAWQRWRKK